MKIAFLNIYNGAVERGSEVFVKEMATKLSQKYSVCVFQSGRIGKENYQIKSISGIPFKPYSWLYDFLVLIFTVKCLPVLWKEKYDWIIPINGRWQAVFCRLFRLFRGGKILISGHAGVGFEDRFNILIGKPDVFVALTPIAYEWAKKISPRANIVYTPNGVDIEKFNPTVKPIRLSLAKPIILCVSALLPYKRIDFLIKALALSSEKAGLLLIGDGPLKKELKTLGDKLLNGRFLLIPSVPYQEINAYYKAAQVFSLPSMESEAFGLVYLEAMACNVPVVAPMDANRKEIIGNAGLYFGIEDINQYSKILDEALKTDFGNKPRLQAERYSWNKIAQRYEKVLLGLVD